MKLTAGEYVCAKAALVRFLWQTCRLTLVLARSESSACYSSPRVRAWAQAHYDALRLLHPWGAHLNPPELRLGAEKIVAIKALTWLRSKPPVRRWADYIAARLRD